MFAPAATIQRSTIPSFASPPIVARTAAQRLSDAGFEGNGANKSAIGDNRRVGPRLSPLARCQHRIPDIRRTSIFEVQPAEVELSFLNATQQFDPCDRDRCGPEQLEAEHRTDT